VAQGQGKMRAIGFLADPHVWLRSELTWIITATMQLERFKV